MEGRKTGRKKDGKLKKEGNFLGREGFEKWKAFRGSQTI